MRNRIKLSLLIITVLIIDTNVIFGQQQNEKPKTIPEMAEIESDRLQKMLSLEPHQVFFVDSTLQHDMAAMRAEIELMQKSGAQDVRSYQSVQEKWMDQIADTYKKIFTQEQWDIYYKQSGLLKKDKLKKKQEEKDAKRRAKSRP